MENPFKPHALGMFADRETVEEALAFSQQLINGMESTQQAAAWTAVMVLVNTASKVWDQQQAPAQGPTAQVTVTMSREELGELINSQVKAYLPPLIEEWADSNLDDKMDSWVDNSLSFEDACDNRVDRWVENNLDLETQVKDILGDRVRDTVRQTLLEDVSISLRLD